ncbi:MAG: archaetidylserine decarboxylase [Firmicutes bacterium]|nr:archaetidylserine decarboxylase [Bacillota bacterium]
MTVFKAAAGWALRKLPFALATRVVGNVFRSRASCILIRPYARLYRVNLAESERTVSEYASLADFFARRLRAGSRVLPTRGDVAVCPVDGEVLAAGCVSEDTMLHIKGSAISVSALLGAIPASRYAQGSYAVIYLAPGDYHRIHAPVGGLCGRIVKIEGFCLPLHAVGRACVPDVFSRNQRAVLEIVCDTEAQGAYRVALVCVGSAIVGSVRLSEACAVGASLSRGEELGWFEFGSTVVVLSTFDGPRIDLSVGARVKALTAMSSALRTPKSSPRPD